MLADWEKKSNTVFKIELKSNVFFFFLPDLINGIRAEKFNKEERDEILSFLDLAFVRLDAWFQWFNTSQKGRSPFFTEFQGVFTLRLLFVFLESTVLKWSHT